MMTRSQDSSVIVTECSLRLSDSMPPKDSPVAKREKEWSESRRSSAPMWVLLPAMP